jgi:hypothetical protein
MNKRLSIISLSIYTCIFLVSGFAICTHGGRIVFYIIMFFLSIVPIVLGHKILKILGIIAIVFALLLTTTAYKSRRTFDKQTEKFIKELHTKELQETNVIKSLD